MTEEPAAGRILAPGKLPGRILDRLLRQYVEPDPDVLIGPEIGADAAALRVGERVIVVKSDPITFPTPNVAEYLVKVNANDIVCMGATPRWLLVTSLLPEGRTTEEMVESQFRELSAASREQGISLVGGHTEITVGLDRPIMIGLLIGEADPGQLFDLRRSRPGDALLLCNGIAIEGTAILANEALSERLASVPSAVLSAARTFAVDPGISVVPAARVLRESGAVIRGMHDPTEGGLATALWEVARITRCDIELDQERIPILKETSAICHALGLDPMGLIASGALLAVVGRDSVERALSHLSSACVQANLIGRLKAKDGEEPAVVDLSGKPIRQFATDEIARFFADGA